MKNKSFILMKKIHETIYNQVERLSDLTILFMQTNKPQLLKRCLSIAENKLKTGSSEVKIAISSIFIFKVSHYLEMNNYNIHQILPLQLDREYIKQVNASGV